MEMIQQLFMIAFVAFVFSILVEKLAFVTINDEKRKSKRMKDNCTKSKSRSESKSRSGSNKKVRFAVHDQIAIVINHKLVKLGAIKRLPTKKQMFTPTSDDWNEVYPGAIWIGEESMSYKELGLHVEPHQLGFGGIQDRREILHEEALALFASDDNVDDHNENITLDYAPGKFID